jgi:hypothetical protein
MVCLASAAAINHVLETVCASQISHCDLRGLESHFLHYQQSEKLRECSYLISTLWILLCNFDTVIK